MKLVLAVLGLLLVSTAFALLAQTHEQRRKNIEQRERTPASKEALERKARSVARLARESVPTIAQLPVIENSKAARTRSAEEIAKRANISTDT